MNLTDILTSTNPLGFVLQNTVARKVLSRTEDAELYSAIKGNVNKQGWVLTLSIIFSVWYIFENGAGAVFQDRTMMTIATGLTVAWFVITFSSVKEIYLDDATDLTFMMFAAFSMPWTLVAISSIAGIFTGVIGAASGTFYAAIIILAWVAAAKYDTLDLVRGNLDELAVEFYRRGIGGRGGIKVIPTEVPTGVPTEEKTDVPTEEKK